MQAVFYRMDIAPLIAFAGLCQAYRNWAPIPYPRTRRCNGCTLCGSRWTAGTKTRPQLQISEPGRSRLSVHPGGPIWFVPAIWRCEFLTRSSEIHFGCPLMRLAAKHARLSIRTRGMAWRQPL